MTIKENLEQVTINLLQEAEELNSTNELQQCLSRIKDTDNYSADFILLARQIAEDQDYQYQYGLSYYDDSIEQAMMFIEDLQIPIPAQLHITQRMKELENFIKITYNRGNFVIILRNAKYTNYKTNSLPRIELIPQEAELEYDGNTYNYTYVTGIQLKDAIINLFNDNNFDYDNIDRIAQKLFNDQKDYYCDEHIYVSRFDDNTRKEEFLKYTSHQRDKIAKDFNLNKDQLNSLFDKIYEITDNIMKGRS